MLLEKQELLGIYGGVKTGFWAALSAGVVFIIGIIDGYFRPLNCR